MNFLSQISLISIPSWAKLLIAALLGFSLVSACYMFIDSVTGQTSETALSASAYLLGIVIPIAIIGVIVLTSYAGERNLVERTEHMLTATLPTALAMIAQPRQSYRDPLLFPASHPPDPDERADVAVSHRRGACRADYLVHLPGRDRFLSLAVEINVRRANLVIGFPGASAGISTAEVVGALHHSLGIGDRDDLFSGDRDGMTVGARGQYQFNPTLTTRQIGESHCPALACTMSLQPDFLWNAAERLYFAQDLAIMLRAFVLEWPEGMIGHG